MFQGSGFGSTSTTTPFGSFAKPATTGFVAAPVFGSTSTSLFGATTQPATGGLFGSTTATPAFGQAQTTQPSFGGFTSGTGTTGLFGSQQNATTSGSGLFGSGATSAFGQTKPAFGGFSTQTTGGGLFGQQASTQQPQAQGTSIFGQTAAAPGNTSIFGSTGFGSTLGGATNTGTGAVKFTAVTGTDTMVKGGVSQTISTRHHCITCMKEYESKSLEELRLEDYAANRKGPQQATGGLFGGSAQPSLFGGGANTSTTTTSLFGGDSKPLFGGTNTMGFSGTSNVFGSPGGSLFGKPAGAPVTFGAATTTAPNTFGFNTSSTTNPFGTSTAQVKPFGSAAPQTSLFGTSTTQPTTGFGTQASGFGSFGAQPTQNIGLFSQNKTPFNVGTSNTGFSFGQTPAATTAPATNISLFGAKPTGTAFGSTFGTPATGTGTSFGSNVFGSTNQNTLFSSTFKPATTGFSFGQTPTTSSTLGTGLNLGGSSFFGSTANKPTGLFGNTSTGTGLFGSSGFGATGSNTFGTGTGTSLGTSMPLGSNTLMGGNTFSSSGNNQANMNPLNQHILALASLPFGDTPLFKNLLPAATGKVDELLKLTSSTAPKSVINGQNYKVSSQRNNKIRVRPLGTSALTKKSLFEGLEDEIEEGSHVSRPNPRRLVLKPKRQDDDLNGDASTTSPIPSRLLPVDTSDSQLQITAPKYFNSKIMQDISKQVNETEVYTPSSSPDSTHSVSKTSLPASTATDQSTNTISMVSLAQSPENTMSEMGTSHLSSSMQSPSENKENVEQQSSSSTSSDSETSEMAASVEETHPAGIILRRVGYYTIPPMDELALLVDNNGMCIVDNFTVGRYNYGNVFFAESFDVSGLNLDEIVHIRHKEIVIYPDDECKPPVGEGLNRPAQVTLDRVWPIDKSTRLPIVDPERLSRVDYEATLRRACAKNSTRFKEYRPQTGSWVFKVDHFSKYGLSDSDEDEPPLSEVKKLRLTVATPTGFPHAPKDLQQLGLKQKLDGPWAVNGQAPPASVLVMEEDDQDMEDSLIKTPFDLDDDYQPTQKSPAMQLAQELGASSHKVQLMKASFFQDEHDDFNMDGDYLDFRGGNILDVEELEQGPKLSKGFPVLRTQFAKQHYAASTPPPAVLAVKVGTDMGEVIPTMPSLGPTAPPPPPVHPQTVSLYHPGGVVCYADSSIKRVNARCLADCALMKGRSFRAGWGKDCTLVSLTTQNVAAVTPLKASLDELGNMLIGRVQPDTSPCIVQRIRILGGQMHDTCSDFQTSIEEHLEIALEHSIQDGGITKCPVFAPKSGVDSLHAHCSLAQRLAQSEINPLFTMSCHVWELCVALWGNLIDLPHHEPADSHKSMMERRQAVSDWLMNVVDASVKRDLTVKELTAKTVFTLLTGHCIQEACQQAQSAGDHCAALLLSQLSGSSSVRSLLEQQLMQWKDAQADSLIDTDRLKLMMLIAGLPVFQATDKVINVCEDLDWKRALAIHFWYVCSPVGSITDALLKYETAFSSSESYACAPNPSYTSEINFEWESSSGKPLYDICYHLLKLYSTRSYPLEVLLNPATHTCDPLDYRLSWFLLRTLESLGYTHVSEYSSAHIHTSFASQLEAHGLWHWAIFVLLHITNPIRREAAVLDVLGRHIDLDENSKEEKFLVNKLKIPVKWIFQAKSIYASAHNKYKEAAVFLIKAEQWNDSHSIIMQHIAARGIINGKYDYLASLLKEFVVEGRSKEISGWSHQGALLWDYLNVVQQVQSVVAKRDPSVGYHLEKLQPELSRLCARINLLPTSTSIHRLCQAEIAKRTAHLVRTVLILQKGGNEKTVGTSIRVLAHLVNQLPLPEDYTKQELQEIIANMVNNFGWQ